MVTFEEEIFSYLTNKDNFNSAFEIYQTFPQIKKTLIEQFWLSVKLLLEELVQNDIGWEIEISNNIFETYSYLSIKLDDDLYASFEKLHEQTYYGLWINHDNKSFDRQIISEYSTSIDAIKWMKKNNYWLGWTAIGENFDNIETLKKTIPEYREDFALELAKLLYGFACDIKPEILKISKMIKY